MSKTDCNELACRYWDGAEGCTASFKEPNSLGTNNCMKRMRAKATAADILSNALDAYLKAEHVGLNTAQKAWIDVLDAQQAYEKAGKP